MRKRAADGLEDWIGQVGSERQHRKILGMMRSLKRRYRYDCGQLIDVVSQVLDIPVPQCRGDFSKIEAGLVIRFLERKERELQDRYRTGGRNLAYPTAEKQS